MPVRVLVVDDSAVVREVLHRALESDPEIEVIGTASDPYAAREQIVALQPDVITLDIEMPRMSGINFLQKLMQHYPLPVIIVSSLTPTGSKMALDAMAAGAVGVFCKPNASYSLNDLSAELIDCVKGAAGVDPRRLMNQAETNRPRVQPTPFSRTTEKIVVIGASTGGTLALERILSRAPSDSPGMVVVQHMPAGFTRAFAQRLDKLCAVEVKEAEHGDQVKQGRVLIAPGNFHTTVRPAGSSFIVDVREGPLVTGHRPSVDVLFTSSAKSLGPRAVGIILIGMGGDGAEGMLAMHKAGAYTLAQDEATCVVFGMPRVAIEKGGVDKVLPLDKLLPEALRFIRAETESAAPTR